MYPLFNCAEDDAPDPMDLIKEDDAEILSDGKTYHTSSK